MRCKFRFSHVIMALFVLMVLTGCRNNDCPQYYQGQVLPYKVLYSDYGGPVDINYQPTYYAVLTYGYYEPVASIEGLNQVFKEGEIYIINYKYETYDNGQVVPSLVEVLSRKEAKDYEVREFTIAPERYNQGRPNEAYNVTDNATGQKTRISLYNYSFRWAHDYFTAGDEYVVKVCCYPPLPEELPVELDDEYQIWALKVLPQKSDTDSPKN